MWASDFPHADHVSNYIEELEEMADILPLPHVKKSSVRTSHVCTSYEIEHREKNTSGRNAT